MRRYRRTDPLRRVAASAALLIGMIAVACSSDDDSSTTSAGATTTLAPEATPAPTTLAPATTPAPATTAVADTAAPDTAAPDTAAPDTGADSGPFWVEPGTDPLGAETAEALQSAIDEWVAAGHLGGLTAAVITPDGTWTGAAGVDAAGTALAPDAAMSLQSISKTFTSAEVLLLSSRGLVDLDAPLADYVDIPFDAAGATVRQALAMQAGFPTTGATEASAAMAADLDRIWTLDEWLATIPADAERLGELGGTPSYNSENYMLLAQLVANVSGKSFAAAVRADLIEPAGLDRVWVQPEEIPTAPLTVGGSTPNADVVDPDGPFVPSASFASITLGAGSMAGDAADVARWGYLLYGGYVIEPALVTEMEADPQDEPNMGPYALGVSIYTDGDGNIFVGHAGGGTDWPYTGVMHVWIGDAPISIALLTPQAADFGADIFEVFMQLHTIAAG